MKLKFLLLLATIGIISACSLDDDQPYCYYQSAMATTQVGGPNTTIINTPIQIPVSFVVGNGCGTFDRFNESTGYPKQIVAIVTYEGCQCSEEASTGIQNYTFNATTAGTYELRFLTENESAPIVKTITVTEE